MSILFGRLKLEDIPYDNPIIMTAFGFMIISFLSLIILITILGKWTYFWKEWFTSVDHKKIAIMYIAVGIVMGVRAYGDSFMIRTNLLFSYGASHGYLGAGHYSEVFSGHGVIMILFVGMPFITGLINLAVPLQIGSRDVAFPFLNLTSVWLFIAGAVLINISLGIGEFAKTGWVAYPPLSEIAYSPSEGVDYYIWSIQIAGLGSILSSINFIVTILKLRAKGMTLMRMPLFSWAALGTNLLIIGAFPILTTVLALLALDRYLGMHFFTNTAGGNMMLYINWFWAWGHPEVYVLILPVFGVFSEVVSTFSGRTIFGYTSMVYSLMAITIISYLVWLHHFFIMGAGGTVNSIFGISTAIIAVPTGVKMYNWLFTLYKGRIRFTLPMLWTLAFLITFVFGGMTGVMLAIPPADFVLHNSQFLIAHFHNTLIGGMVFGFLAGFNYWFPKAFGFTLNEKLGKIGFWLFVSGFYVTFVPLYILGFMGMTRRLNHYTNPHWQIPILIAAIGVLLIGAGVLFFIAQVLISFYQRKQRLDTTGDPWNGRTLEWSISSPPPEYNFAIQPKVKDRDEFWQRKLKGTAYQKPKPTAYQPILMFKNTATPLLIGGLSIALGFALTWHIWWLVIASLIGLLLVIIIRCSQDDVYYYVPANEVEETDEKHWQKIKQGSSYAR